MPITYYRRRRSRARRVFLVPGGLLVVFVLIQLVPYGRNHSNPPVAASFKWSSAPAKAIAERSCYDCHSNRTTWWWAVDVAPFSWLAQHDISAGRARLNFSDWHGTLSAQGLRYALQHGMPPLQFTLIHPSANLTVAEQQQLLAGFRQSLVAQRQSSSGETATVSGSSASAPPSSSSGESASAIINARCATCHSSAPAQQFRAASASQAQALIDQMIQQGAVVTPAEEQTLVKYFTR